MQRYVIKGETPSKKNSVKFSYRTGRTYKTERFRDWHSAAQTDLLIQLRRDGFVKPDEETYKCKIALCFVHGDKRRRDSDNGTSTIFDLLTDCGVIPDDKWAIVTEHHVYNAYKKDEPCCVICIYDIDEEISYEDFQISV